MVHPLVEQGGKEDAWSDGLLTHSCPVVDADCAPLERSVGEDTTVVAIRLLDKPCSRSSVRLAPVRDNEGAGGKSMGSIEDIQDCLSMLLSALRLFRHVCVCADDCEMGGCEHRREGELGLALHIGGSMVAGAWHRGFRCWTVMSVSSMTKRASCLKHNLSRSQRAEHASVNAAVNGEPSTTTAGDPSPDWKGAGGAVIGSRQMKGEPFGAYT